MLDELPTTCPNVKNKSSYSDQTTGHNRLKPSYMAHKAEATSLPPMSVWQESDSRAHPAGLSIHSALRDTTWPEETALQKKLYGPKRDLERTARFTLQSGLTI
ncbi:hypothetical protein V1264_006439 [Littorina saxatilis]|uniref:Uncharacterized protein n=1 Tax=Littorina saxatilis TaxID=31220 RepID=A0AAN9G4X9_9CAEN